MQALLNVKAAGTYSDHSALKGGYQGVPKYLRDIRRTSLQTTGTGDIVFFTYS
jgi:hypothetical protein